MPNEVTGMLPVDAPAEPLDRRRRARRAVAALVAVIVIPVVLLFGSYQLRRSLFGDSVTVCIVTAESLRTPGNDYSGGDHPLAPQVGDQYVGHSGCNAFETQCQRTTELIGTRLEC